MVSTIEGFHCSTESIITDPTGCSNHSVGYKVQVKPHPLEDILEDLDDLQSQNILPDVVSHFEDTGLPDATLQQLGGVGF